MQIRGVKGNEKRAIAASQATVVYLEAKTAEDAFKKLDAAGCDCVFIELESVEEYLDAMAYVPTKQVDKMKAAQLVGMRETVCWQQGLIWALPNWTWRVAYLKAPVAVPLQAAQSTAAIVRGNGT
jgi:hypothetical protein